jgi:hypothetical protein
VVGRLQVNIAEDFFPLELFKKVINPGNGATIPDCDFV